jgi:hypothetical protein
VVSGREAEVTIPGIATVLVSYSTPVAAIVDGEAIWSPDAAATGQQRSHLRRWLITMGVGGEAREVPAATLTDLFRLVPAPLPHFNGTGPHRYENGKCVYCGREAEATPPEPVAWIPIRGSDDVMDAVAARRSRWTRLHYREEPWATTLCGRPIPAKWGEEVWGGYMVIGQEALDLRFNVARGKDRGFDRPLIPCKRCSRHRDGRSG